ncbi:hypothetical protein CEXT_455721 [Caerostris extrusa]|uniref:Uncharacterized protein n=1 Tax=Caerostris extrusa TaxID=172846 RepID=A0AAV4MV42_CAEEX|nr:hypothetical protein CEXT_455721 [Caerostris extrusa]
MSNLLLTTNLETPREPLIQNLLLTQERIRDYRYSDMEEKPQKVLPTPVVLTKEERLLQFEKKSRRMTKEKPSPVSLHNQKKLSMKHTVSLETPDHPVLLHNQRKLQQKRPFLLPLPEYQTLLPTSNTLNAVPLPRVESNAPICSTYVPKNDQRKALCKQQHFSSSTENALSSTSSFYPFNQNSEKDSYSDIENEFCLYKQKYYNQEKLPQNRQFHYIIKKKLSRKHTVSLETPDHPVLLHNQRKLQQKRPFLLPLPEYQTLLPTSNTLNAVPLPRVEKYKTLLPTSDTLNAVPLPRVESNTPIYSPCQLQETLPPQVPDRPLSTPVPSLSPPVISIRHDNLLAPSPTDITYQNNLLSQPPTNSIVNSPSTIRPLFSQFIPGQNSYAGSQNGGLPSQQHFYASCFKNRLVHVLWC